MSLETLSPTDTSDRPAVCPSLGIRTHISKPSGDGGGPIPFSMKGIIRGAEFMLQKGSGGWFGIVVHPDHPPYIVMNGRTGSFCSKPKDAFFFTKRFIKDLVKNGLRFRKFVYWKELQSK